MFRFLSIIIAIIALLVYNIQNYSISGGKEVLNLANYRSADLDSASSDFKYTHPYPYKKYNMTADEILARFNRLKNYEPIIKHGKAPLYSLPKNTDYKLLEFDGKFIYICVEDEYYNLYDNISDYFQEEQRVNCKRLDQPMSSHEYWNKNYKDVIKATYKKYDVITAHTLRETLYSLWFECTSFRPSLFVGFYKLLGKERPIKRVLDISMGWGDRLIGALAAQVELYVGTDPNTKLFAGYNEIINTFKGNAVCINSGFESADIDQYKPFDMIFSSPPYFNLETYTDDLTQSIYKRDLSAWYSEWLIPALKKALNVLDIGGYLVININNIRHEPDYTIRMVNEMSNLVKYRGCIPQWSGNVHKSAQPFWIWQKQ